MTKRIHVSCALLLIVACTSEPPTPTDNAEPNDLSPPVEGPPPQQSAADQETEARREEAQPGTPLSPTAPEQGNPPGASAQPDASRARAKLEAIGDAKLQATVTLEERARGVVVSVQVEGGEPGPRSVRVFESNDCNKLQPGNLVKPFEATLQHGEVGRLTVAEDGTGKLEVSADEATLQPHHRASLLGKAIVVQERGMTGDASGKPLACGVIQLDKERADKSGRTSGAKGSGTTAMRAP